MAVLPLLGRTDPACPSSLATRSSPAIHTATSALIAVIALLVLPGTARAQDRSDTSGLRISYANDPNRRARST